MLTAPKFTNEKERQVAAMRLGLSADAKPENKFDVLTKEATERLKVPISTFTVLDANREYFKSCQGLDTAMGERAISFCGHALVSKELFMIPDCRKDPRFADNPMVTGKPFIRFYAGMALYDYMTRMPVAVFCVKDAKPRTFSLKELEIFLSLCTRAEELMNGVSEGGLTNLPK